MHKHFLDGMISTEGITLVRFLGLILDENFSWKYHHSEQSKIARTFDIFFKIKIMLVYNVLLYLYNALFADFLQYGIKVRVHFPPALILFLGRRREFLGLFLVGSCLKKLCLVPQIQKLLRIP